MMKRIVKLLIPISLLFIILSSCIKEIDLNLPQYKDKIIVNSIFGATKNIEVYLYLTFPSDSVLLHYEFSGGMYDTLKLNEYPKINNAEISLYEDNIFKEKLNLKDSGYYVSQLKVKAQSVYTIEVNVPGFETVTASDTVPATLPFKIQDTGTIDQDSNNIFMLTAPNNPSSFYRTHSQTVTDSSLIHDLFFYDYSQYPPINYVQGILMKNIFDKDSVRMLIKYNSKYYQNFAGADYQVLFGRISYAYYKYYETLAEQPVGDDQIFAQPVAVYSNIKNGYGIFAAYNDGEAVHLTK